MSLTWSDLFADIDDFTARRTDGMKIIPAVVINFSEVNGSQISCSMLFEGQAIVQILAHVLQAINSPEEFAQANGERCMGCDACVRAV